MSGRAIVAAFALAVSAFSTPTPAEAVTTARPFDFNGDGFLDLAVGVPGAPVRQQQGAGQVHVIFGSDGGPSESDALVSAALSGSPKELAALGSAITSADFNADGFAELVAAAPDADLSYPHQGEVKVFHGSSSGFDAGKTEDLGLLSGPGKARASFGWALAVGDFDNDGFPDLAVGSPGATPSGVGFGGDGRVTVFYGDSVGIKDGRTAEFDENTSGINTMSHGSSDGFGDALATGDFNRDGYIDLAIGVPGFAVSNVPQAGAVRILLGSGSGLTTTDSELWSLNSPGIKGRAESTTNEDDVVYGDRFGSALAAADFDGDGFQDLAVGAPDKGRATTRRGAVSVLYGSASGISSRDQYFDQSTPGIPGRLGHHYFGGALASGNFEGSSDNDLAIGVPDATVNGRLSAGNVIVIRGGDFGLRLRTASMYTEGTPGIPGRAQSRARFGSSIRALGLDGDAFDEVIVGIPGQKVGTARLAGAVDILFGQASGQLTNRVRRLTENSPGMRGTADPLDEFGRISDCLRRTDKDGHTR